MNAKHAATRIIDETELTRTIKVGERAYTVPKDVADSHDALVKALQEAQHYLRFNEQETSPHMQRIAAALAAAGTEVPHG